MCGRCVRISFTHCHLALAETHSCAYSSTQNGQGTVFWPQDQLVEHLAKPSQPLKQGVCTQTQPLGTTVLHARLWLMPQPLSQRVPSGHDDS